MSKPVLILEDDPDLSVLEEKLLQDNGFDVIAVESVQSMVVRYRETLDCSVALLDIDLGSGQPSGLDAFRWLIQQGFPGRLFFLTGHGSGHPLVSEARAIGQVEVLTKPISAKTLLKLVGENCHEHNVEDVSHISR